ncbi:hypothetical protein GIB67_024243 [Kingdonia uniflora]|uniref:RING-type domain-containing protein n=1 Tax=Kingdonia uniflora TaxID=39325 RepID=A0A7J7LZW7_9MAGN|nr:hypothetical protein GIB67_024243 [Kingdonia uniflora]
MNYTNLIGLESQISYERAAHVCDIKLLVKINFTSVIQVVCSSYNVLLTTHNFENVEIILATDFLGLLTEQGRANVITHLRFQLDEIYDINLDDDFWVSHEQAFLDFTLLAVNETILHESTQLSVTMNVKMLSTFNEHANVAIYMAQIVWEQGVVINRLESNEYEATPETMELTCPICLEPYVQGAIGTATPCKHMFHKRCLFRQDLLDTKVREVAGNLSRERVAESTAGDATASTSRMHIHYALLRQLTPSRDRWTLKVRLNRMWITKNFTTKEIWGQDMLLIDENDEQIHASVPRDIIPQFDDILKEGDIIHLTKFNVSKSNGTYRPIDGEYKIYFKNDTIVNGSTIKFTIWDEMLDEIPIDLSQLPSIPVILIVTSTIVDMFKGTATMTTFERESKALISQSVQELIDLENEDNGHDLIEQKLQNFSLKQKNGDAGSVEISVSDYYEKSGMTLSYSAEFSCINAGKPKRRIYLRLEICDLVSLQRENSAMFPQFGATSETLSKAATSVMFRIGTDAHLYDDPDDVNIAPLLDSRYESEKCEALKRLLALIAQGFDVSKFFPQVVKNVASHSLEVKKLVYLYLLHYAEKHGDDGNRHQAGYVLQQLTKPNDSDHDSIERGGLWTHELDAGTSRAPLDVDPALAGGCRSRLEASIYQAEGLRVPTGPTTDMVDKNSTEKSKKRTKQWEIARKASEERVISYGDMQGHIWEPGGSNFSQPGIPNIVPYVDSYWIEFLVRSFNFVHSFWQEMEASSSMEVNRFLGNLNNATSRVFGKVFCFTCRVIGYGKYCGRICNRHILGVGLLKLWLVAIGVTCSQKMSPVMEVEIKCPFCESEFVEEIGSNNKIENGEIVVGSDQMPYVYGRPNEALLSINCFQKDLSDPNPLVRAWALRAMAGIRIHDIAPIVLVAVGKCARDPSAYVRKCAANALPKLNDLHQEENANALEEIVCILLIDHSPGVVGAAAAAFNSVCPNSLLLIGRNFRRLCETLPDVEEWGQIVLIEILLRYIVARHGLMKESVMFSSRPKYEEANIDFHAVYNNGGASNMGTRSEDSNFCMLLSRCYIEGPDEYLSRASNLSTDAFGLNCKDSMCNKDNSDVKVLLQCTSPLLWSHNSAVVLAAAGVHWIMASMEDVKRIVRPLLFLLRSFNPSKYLVLCNIQVFAKAVPSLFAPHFEDFFISSSDSYPIKSLNLDILSTIATDSSIPSIFQEFQAFSSK